MRAADARQLALAEAIARRQHAGQADKAGEPYWEHPAAVASRLLARGKPRLAAAAWLHDVPEDTGETLEELRAEGVAEDVLAIVEALTHVPGTPRDTYYAALVAAGPDAIEVKECDIRENTRPDRLARLGAADRERLEAKYAKARRALGLPAGEERA